MGRIPTLFKYLTGHLQCWGITLVLVTASATASMELDGPIVQDIGSDHEVAQTNLQQGDYAHALTHAREAVARTDSEPASQAHLDALLELAAVYQVLGQQGKAIEILKTATPIVARLGDSARAAAIMASLGRSYAQTGASRLAETYLRDAAEAAHKAKQPTIAAAAYNNLGNLLFKASRYEDALTAYGKTIVICRQIDTPELLARASANAARASLQLNEFASATDHLDQAQAATRTLEPSHDKAYLLINIARTWHKIVARRPELSPDRTRRMYELLQEARDMAREIHDRRAESWAIGYTAKLYADNGRIDDALALTTQARFIAQQANAPEILYRWQWQAGRLLAREGKLDEAIQAYRQAVRTLQPIRYDIDRGYGDNSSLFREITGPLYYQLADLLLQRSQPGSHETPDSIQAYRREARDIIEQFKAAELEDYFQDDCVARLQARTAGLDELEAHTAVLYPIPLENRTELLVSLPGTIEQFTIPVGTEDITTTARNFRKLLEKRTTHQYRRHAQQLYTWLVAPAEKTLTEAEITTLVIVPDGALRTIPWAALHDGKEFLIKRYAIAYTPGLEVTDPRSLEREGLKILLNGLTTARHGFPSLPYVGSEIHHVHDIYGGTVLLDQDYLVKNMQQALQQTPYSVVHIASHSQFNRDLDQTFLLAYDGKISMDQLQQFVGMAHFRETPVELLTLSACQTAAGDDRAALGLAGIAVKSGARSVLATLWFINDQATSEIVIDFYTRLEDPAVSKARALQIAQIDISSDLRYRHPGYWAPYLLIGNWL